MFNFLTKSDEYDIQFTYDEPNDEYENNSITLTISKKGSKTPELKFIFNKEGWKDFQKYVSRIDWNKVF